MAAYVLAMAIYAVFIFKYYRFIAGRDIEMSGGAERSRAVAESAACYNPAMELSADYHFDKEPQAVWDALMNPNVLAGCIPGCRSIEPDGPDRYRASATIRVGPISGNFTATVALSELNPPHSYKMTIEGSGNLGFVSGVSTVTLTPAAAGGTDLHVDTDGQVGGAVARVGQRMMGSVAKGMMDRFFGCLAESA